MLGALCVIVVILAAWVIRLRGRINLLEDFACNAIDHLERHDHQFEMLARTKDRSEAHKWN